MRLSTSGLTVKPEVIEQGRVLVAEDQHGRRLGVAAIEPTQSNGKFDLSLLFVEPSAIRCGLGASCSRPPHSSSRERAALPCQFSPIRSPRRFINISAPR
jgi:hypothetical protein